jgi:hypothetical protein
VQRLRPQGNAANVADKPMALTPEQLYKIGAESLGWNNSSTAGKALIAEDMKLLKRLQLAHGSGCATYWTNQYNAIGRK